MKTLKIKFTTFFLYSTNEDTNTLKVKNDSSDLCVRKFQMHLFISIPQASQMLKANKKETIDQGLREHPDKRHKMVCKLTICRETKNKGKVKRRYNLII